MKLQKSILASILFLLLGAGLAAAAPEISAPAAPTGEIAAPADVFGASVLSSSQDCAASDLPRTNGLDSGTCGSCSPAICQGKPVDNYCGFSEGKIKVCQDYLGTTCPADGGARCRCSSDPLP